MSFPAGPPPGPQPAAAAPRRRRPRGTWFLLPLVMMVLGVAMLVYGFVSTLAPLGDEDAVVPVDGQPHVVALDEPGPRLLMGLEGQAPPDCVVLDADGSVLEVGGPGADYTFSDGSGAWSGYGRVESTGDEIELTCTVAGTADGGDGGGSGEVRVLADPGGLSSIFSGLGLIFGGIAIGGIGFVVLVVLLLLYLTGAPRRTTAEG